MSSFSRRELFLGSLKKNSGTSGLQQQEKSEVVIGKIADFSVGEKKLLAQHQITVESFSEGLRVRSNNNKNKFYSIKANQSGELIVNRSENWPPRLVFSILTYEPTEFDSSQEGRS